MGLGAGVDVGRGRGGAEVEVHGGDGFGEDASAVPDAVLPVEVIMGTGGECVVARGPRKASGRRGGKGMRSIVCVEERACVLHDRQEWRLP